VGRIKRGGGNGGEPVRSPLGQPTYGWLDDLLMSGGLFGEGVPW
jgi:hypothetical protein